MDLPPGPVVKICGLTRAEDVAAACSLGVWALGLVFAPSPRRLVPSAARALLRGAGLGRGSGMPGAAPLAVGVFVDEPVEEIARVVDEVGLDGVQLHGLRGGGAARVRPALEGLGRPVLVIQAVPVDPDSADAAAVARALQEAFGQADALLLDTHTGGRFGGSGRVFPWHLARAAGRELPLLVSGGIEPDNVQTALAESGAWGVDVSSGVESAPGIKDAELMRRLVSRVKGDRAA